MDKLKNFYKNHKKLSIFIIIIIMLNVVGIIGGLTGKNRSNSGNIDTPVTTSVEPQTQPEPEKPKSNTLSSNNTDREVMERMVAKDAVLANLKDPDSAEFRNQHGICGEVNSKNSFGGYSGFKRYVATSKSLVVIEGEGMADDEFEKVWQQFCN